MTEIALYIASEWGAKFHLLPHNEALGAGDLAVDTLLPTPLGMRAIGDVVVGDRVFGADGFPCTVIGEQYPPPQDCYLVGFDDGTEIVAGRNHIWRTMSYLERKQHLRTGTETSSLRTTQQIAESMKHRGRVNHVIPVTAIAHGAAASTLPVDPWLIGQWLANGRKDLGRGFEITSPWSEVAAEMQKAADDWGLELRTNPGHGACFSFYIAGKKHHQNPLVAAMRALFPGSPAEYGIPEQYQLAAEWSRWRLLQGLIDGDGHITKAGVVQLSFNKPDLTKDCYRLICSLGFKCTMDTFTNKSPRTGEKTSVQYRLHFSGRGQAVSTVAAKQARVKDTSRTTKWRYIVSCERVATVPTKCIQVDSRNSLFLVTEACVITHNSAGPGKSLVLLMDPLPRIQFEHHRCTLSPDDPLHIEWGRSKGWALHLRRTLPMLRQTVDRSHLYFPAIDPGAKWSAAENTWTFSSGYKMEFGHCREKTDYARYLSNQYDWIGFDELVQFDEEQYDQISLRVRSDDPILMKQLKVRAMSNPLTDFEGMEGVTLSNPQWVRDRFVRPCPQGGKTHFRWITRRDGTKEKRTWIYLRATLYDNPNKEYVKVYEAQLLAGKPHLRQAYLEGDWEVTAGSFFADVWDAKMHVCEPFKVPKDWLRFRSMDWGFKAPGVIHWWAMDPDGNLFCIREHKFNGPVDSQRKTATEVAKDVKDIEEGMNLWTGSKSAITGPADTQLWEERGVSAMSMAEEFMRAGVPWMKAEKGPGSRARNAARIYQRLEDHGHGTTTPGIVFFRHCRYIIQTLPGIQTDPKDINSPQDGGEDHAFDSTAYACAFASRGRIGIPKRLNDDDDYDLPPKPREEMGRYGYGGRLH